jgi:hypothetical protein
MSLVLTVHMCPRSTSIYVSSYCQKRENLNEDTYADILLVHMCPHTNKHM